MYSAHTHTHTLGQPLLPLRDGAYILTLIEKALAAWDSSLWGPRPQVWGSPSREEERLPLTAP